MVQEVADGRIFVHHNGAEVGSRLRPRRQVHQALGQRIRTAAAHGMDLRKEGNEEFLYFAPTEQHRVIKTNLKGEKVFELGVPKDAKNADGQAVLRERREIRPDVHRLRPRRRRLLRRRRLRLQLRPPLQHQGRIHLAPSAAPATATASSSARTASGATRATPPTRLILVADRANVRLQWFTLDGKFIKMVTDELRHPCHFDQQGTDILIPDLHGRVTIFDKDNKLVTHLGDNPNPDQRGKNETPKEELVARRLLHAARRDLGQGRQHLRRRVAAVRR